VRNILSAVLFLVAIGQGLAQSPAFEVYDAGIDDVCGSTSVERQ
jgi:hypothetical protein